MALSAALHAALCLAAWGAMSYEPDQMTFLTYEIELVSPPPALEEEEEVREATEDLVIERPEPEPLPPEPEPEEVVPAEEPEPAPEPPPQPEEPPAEVEPQPEEETRMATAPEAPEEQPEVTGEDLAVRIEGLRRDYPAYYDNIIRQIQRCFRWREGGRWQTTIFFWIERDGAASGIEFETRSGNTSFDFEAMGAIDCAGGGRFGPLPEELPYDRFPVRFTFRPSGRLLFLPSHGVLNGVM